MLSSSPRSKRVTSFAIFVCGHFRKGVTMIERVKQWLRSEAGCVSGVWLGDIELIGMGKLWLVRSSIVDHDGDSLFSQMTSRGWDPKSWIL
jgi:hypothetical protein